PPSSMRNPVFNSTAAAGNSYTGDFTNPGYRMHLDSLSELATDNNPPKVWKFNYLGRALPAYKSFAQDFWGYYNGQTSNTTLLPFEFNFNPASYPVGNRTPDSASMMAEMLTKVTYPTGGFSQFSWEPNNYPAYQETFGQVFAQPTLDLDPAAESRTDTVYTFTITQAQFFSYSFLGTFSSTILADFGTSANMATSTLKDASGTELLSLVIKKGDNNVQETSASILLNPGTYTFQISTFVDPADAAFPGFANMSATFTYTASTGFQWVENYVGGLRVKNIVYHDGLDSTKDIQKFYTYEQPYLVEPIDPLNDYLSSVIDKTYDCSGGFDEGTGVLNGPCGFPGCVLYSVQYFGRSSSTKAALGTIQGGAIGYTKVTENFGPNGENGKNVYYYTSEGDLNIPSSRGLPYPAIVSLDYERGLLNEEDTYTATGQLVHKAINSYQFLGKDTITTYKCAYQFNIKSGCYNANPFSQLVLRIFYTDLTNQVMHLSTTDITYNTANGDSVQVVTRYDYQNPLNMQPTRTAKMDSKGDSVVVYSRTALEKSTINSSISLSGAASTAVDSMLARNMVGLPVETEKYVQGNLTDKILTNYKVQPAGPLPDNVMVQNRSNPLETRIFFPEYDGYGNLLEQQKSADQRHDYIYGYSGNYAIAEVTNGDSTSIAYTSFENSEGGNWSIGSGTYDSTSGITGRSCYALNGSISKTGLTSGTTYFVSYWSQGNAFTIAGTLSGYPMKGKTIFWNGFSWTLYVHKVSGQSTITVSGNGRIDELRLYPVTAQMTTYTYDPLVGMTSKTDVGNRVTYFEYDGFQRLKRIRDQDYNILKSFDYQYQASSGCGGGCYIVPMQTFSGSATLSYPVGVFSVNGKLLGNAANPDQYVSAWNSDTADNRVGTLAKGGDSLHFNLTLNTGQTLPPGVMGCRYYQWDLPWNIIDGVDLGSGVYVDFGDGTVERFPKNPADTFNLAPTTHVIDGFSLVHTYADTSLKTITIYHNDGGEAIGMDNAARPATSLTKLRHLRGNFPQYTFGGKFSSMQQPSAMTMESIYNWNSITTITSFQLQTGDGGANACMNLHYAQDFMKNNRGLQFIDMAGGGIHFTGVRDTTFTMSRFKSDWNTYFTNLQVLGISEELWNHEDLTALINLKVFLLAAATQHHTNAADDVEIRIPASEIDAILNQIAAGAGQHVKNGYIEFIFGSRTSASDTAVAQLQANGWQVIFYP
ncbi:MAG TPA: hypothetical protein VNW04_01010, partial [Puia sp.]|nr:hypothetical protein [Puia sp.]